MPPKAHVQYALFWFDRGLADKARFKGGLTDSESHDRVVQAGQGTEAQSGDIDRTTHDNLPFYQALH